MLTHYIFQMPAALNGGIFSGRDRSRRKTSSDRTALIELSQAEHCSELLR